MAMTKEAQENWKQWLVYAEKQGVPQSYRQVPFDLIFQKMGFNFPPLLFWPFPAAVLVMGVYFGIFWGVLMYFFVWRKEEQSPQAVALASAGAGLLFGVAMAWLYTRARRKYALPPWVELQQKFNS